MKWQKIETAPKDGTKILIYGEGQFDCAAWANTSYEEQILLEEGPNKRVYEVRLVQSGYWDTAIVDYATHWMPLLPPPSEADE